MKGFNVRIAVARSMGAVFYLVLFIIVCGFAMNMASGRESGGMTGEFSITGLLKGAAALDGNSALALAAYISAMSPFLFSAVIFFGYLIQKRYKAALLGLVLLCVLSLSLLVKSA